MSDQNNPNIVIDPVVFSRDQLKTYADYFRDYEGGPLPYVAQQVSNEIQTDYPEYISYQGLRDGTAKIFDLNPDTKNMDAKQRAMSDEDIIRFLAVGPEGEEIQKGTLFQGFKENIIPEAGGIAGFMAGAKAGMPIQAGIPPAGPAALAAKVAIPLFTGLMGSMAGRSLFQAGQEAVVGEGPPIIPGTEPEYEAGRTAATVIAALPIPFTLSRNLTLGGAQYLENLRNAREILTGGAKVKPMGPLTPEQTAAFGSLSREQQARIAAGKGYPVTARFSKFIDQMLADAGQTARAKPIRTLAGEALPGAGAVIGAEIAEREAPGEMGPRIALETAGSLAGAAASAPAMILANNFETILPAFRNVRENFQRGGIKGVIEPLSQGRQLAAVKRIIEILEAEGQDVEKIIQLLSSNELSQYLVDASGKPLKLTAGAKTGNPVLLAMETSLENIGSGLGAERSKGAKDAIEALRNVVTAMSLSGDRNALQQVGVLAKNIFDAELTENLTNATNRVLKAYENVTPTNESNMQLSEALYDVVKQELGKARERERRLWGDVQEDTFQTFTNPAGEVIDQPNFLARWEALLPETQEARARIEDALPALTKFIRRKQNEFAPEEAAAEGAEVATRLTGQDQRRLDTLQNQVQRAEAKVRSNVEKLDAGRRTSTVQGQQVTLGNFSEQIQTALNRIADVTSSTSTLERVARFDDLPRADQINYLNQLERYIGGQETPLSELNFGIMNPLNKLKDAAAGDRRNMVSFLRNRRALLEKQQELDAFQSGLATRPEPEAPPMEPGTLTSKELTEMRAVALDLARQESAKVEGSNAARVAYAMADELLDELERQRPEGADTAYDAARAYSRSLNDTFTRSFAYLVRDKTRSGANRRAPELMAEDLFKGSADATYLRLQEINEIGEFAQQQGLEGAEDTINTLAGINERLLRNAALNAFDPDTGEISPRRLSTWMNQNEQILNQFPDLKRDLQDAEKAKLLLDETSVANKNRQRDLQSQVSFMDLLPETTENPTTAVSRALSSGNKRPFASLNELKRYVTSAPEDMQESAMSGLKSSILEWAMTKGGRTGSTFSPMAVYRSIFEPLPKTETSLAKWMVGNGVAKEKELDQLETFLREMVRYEIAETSGSVDDLIKNTGPILDFYVRLAGATVGAKAAQVAGGGSGNSLVAAGAGSRVFRNIIEKIPAALQTDVMLELMRNPQLLATMMRKARTEQDQKRVASTLERILGGLGFAPVRRTGPTILREEQRDEVTPEMIERYIGIPQQAPVQPPMQPPQPQAQVMPPMAMPTAQAPAPQAQPNLQQRQQYAAMFPYESTSQMIRGGIGSLA